MEQHQGLTAEMYRAVVAVVDDRVGEIRVTREDFADTLRSVEPLVEGEVWRVMFGYYIHPSAQPVAEEHRILLVASYQR
jgi:hypothetical protein